VLEGIVLQLPKEILKLFHHDSHYVLLAAHAVLPDLWGAAKLSSVSAVCRDRL
jgi:hypothetical protein